MRRILNIALGDMSTGELGIAIAFMKNLNPDQYCNYLLIPEEKKGILQDSGFNVFSLSKDKSPMQNRAIAENIIQTVAPDLIILFDIFTFEYAQNWTGCNTDFLKAFGIPMASIDEYEYTLTNYKIDYYGVFVKRLPDLLSQCDFVLKNCLLSMPKSDTALFDAKKYFYYRVFEKLDRITAEERKDLRKEYFDVDDDNEKVIFFTTSLWEVSGAYSFSCQNALAGWLGLIVYHYLKDLGSKVVLVHVGTENWEIHSDEKVRYIHFDSLKSTAFDRVIQAADLFLTYNIVSISLSKAVLYGVPSLVLNNQNVIEFGKLEKTLRQRPAWYQAMAEDVKKVYPFAASLFGWPNFLKVCLSDNVYKDSFDVANVFNYRVTMEQLKSILFDTAYRKEVSDRMVHFSDRYYQIASPKEVLDKIFNDVEREV